MVGTPSTANSFTYLELGVLPIKYEIHWRQLIYYHHILSLADDDPVNIFWRNMTMLVVEANWWNDVTNSMIKYSILVTEEEAMQMNKDAFKKMINKAVVTVAFEELREECASKSKTKKHDLPKVQETGLPGKILPKPNIQVQVQ